MKVRPVRVLATLALLALLSIAGATLLLRHERATPLVLPAPTGPLPVGRLSQVWQDGTRTDPGTTSPRRLVVWIWYPAAPRPGDRRAEYLPAPWRAALSAHAGPFLTTFTRDYARVQAHAFADAPLSPARRTWPVLLMNSGIGALSTDYTVLAEDLASHGYVVVATDKPYSTGVVVFPDGGVVQPNKAGHPPERASGAELMRLVEQLVGVWSADTRFVLDELVRLNASDPSGRFTGRLELARVGVLGHSFGGATAAQFCHDDARCAAGIDMDGQPFGSVVRAGLRQPFMFLLSDHRGEATDSAGRSILARLDSIYQGLPPDRRYWVTVRGAHHFSFTDMSLTKSQYVLGLLGKLGVFGGLDGRRGLAITRTCVRAFFDVYLRGAPPAQLTRALAGYAEVTTSKP